MITFDEIDALATGMPGAAVETKWGRRTYVVGGKGFAWQRPFSKADLKRFGDDPVPEGEILAVRVESLDAKDALLAIAPPGFFTIPHFNGYAAVLIALRQARVTDVRAALRDAYQAMSAAKKPRAAARKPRATARKPRATAKKPGATAKKPRATARKPGVIAKKPRAAAHKPRAAAHEPRRRAT